MKATHSLHKSHVVHKKHGEKKIPLSTYLLIIAVGFFVFSFVFLVGNLLNIPSVAEKDALSIGQGKTCAELNGNNCNSYESCLGNILQSIDSANCCETSCVSIDDVNSSDGVVSHEKVSGSIPIAKVTYYLEFNKITVKVIGENFDDNMLGQLFIFGEPAAINKVLVNNSEVKYNLNQVYSNAGYLSNISPFLDSSILVEYSYDPDDLGGNYCIGESCIIQLYPNLLLPIEFTYEIDSAGYNLFDFSLSEEQADSVFILTKELLYEKEGFILLGAQQKSLDDSKLKLSRFSDLVSKTNSFLGKSNKKATLFLVPDGMLQALYFNNSSIILLPLYESNQANMTFAHEYSHFLLNDSYFPMWIQEGIAEYVSKKVTYSTCGSWIDKGTNLLDWGVIEIPREDIPDLYGYACSGFMYFDSKFGVDKTKELIREFENIVESDPYSNEYSNRVESILEKVSGEKITIKEFIDKSY